MSNLFASLGLAEPLVRAVSAEGYETPTPIQAQTIPLILSGRDVLGLAQTGTGKTAAFALPILQRIAESGERAASRMPVALILAPTRELAVQIAESFRVYGGNMRIRTTAIFGGVGIRPQIDAMQRGVEIVVATPGRLMDLMEQNCIRLDRVRTLVLDEADRMLDMGFIRPVRQIVRALPRARQSLLFSATMSPDVGHLCQEILHNPERVTVTPKVITVDRIDQRVFHVTAGDKPRLLQGILADPALARVMVFTRTKHGANRVCERLEAAGISADAIHGNKSQGARQAALARFRSGDTRVLVATDLAARGLDVDGITHVINFELPNEPESYVHRIGRTARAGAEGIAIAFCDSSERSFLRDIERLIRRPLTPVQLPDLRGVVLPEKSKQPAYRDPRDNRDQRPRGQQPSGGRPGSNDNEDAPRAGRPQRTNRRRVNGGWGRRAA
jgi:ATP-dependent RNA helicase RhlE